ncbi:hypothetical protein UFOVP1138_71 [uncultured Caudovirales phage]|uniref:Uncharacterized protein n=1 Tax=uncultured Caudovirales phage TaxID=2100421 RepID=A0A6J5S7C7_9CAUD|nr:hypothetical protein UFOVP975_49 [uncultured Caudovirales phage]CAB4186311.1 hypothetical protein UFOVP1138_71 [uncultured Caudovirales phage]CAB4204449.1 hypothetical protein UFOVP1394_68 [uncultured Caudovirales phage]
MGYKSDVAYIIEFNNEYMARKYMAEGILGRIKAFEEPEQYMKDLAKDFTRHGKYIKFEVEQWKWYESHDDVSFCKNVFDRSEESEGFIGARFIRVGEDEDDLEIVSIGDAPYERIGVPRCIEIDLPPESLDNMEDLDEPDC